MHFDQSAVCNISILWNTDVSFGTVFYNSFPEVEKKVYCLFSESKVWISVSSILLIMLLKYSLSLWFAYTKSGALISTIIMGSALCLLYLLYWCVKIVAIFFGA